ncbi:hypothetical protein [Boudabousia marimammalium]|uniref:Uncharacterized protein n=1 Tax=Boudabousia marimammalium TaxID=156892 RepID=A0A1Q5PSZ6_9ACTO|nr:hypothetical protein [Boudabousia marimammalium]OKL50639.1 hypothetical protein BM477_01420 [Boudabousia marimammalium]
MFKKSKCPHHKGHALTAALSFVVLGAAVAAYVFRDSFSHKLGSFRSGAGDSSAHYTDHPAPNYHVGHTPPTGPGAHGGHTVSSTGHKTHTHSTGEDEYTVPTTQNVSSSSHVGSPMQSALNYDQDPA